jgi:predicted secreted Zn-dependent protease
MVADTATIIATKNHRINWITGYSQDNKACLLVADTETTRNAREYIDEYLPKFKPAAKKDH